MKNIHDRGYKKLFSNKVIFRQLIETFVHEDWVKDLDFEHCETIDKSFISANYKATESDLIYKLKLKGRDVYVVILIEFQSTVYRFMALRMLNYSTNFYMDYVESNKHVSKLPSVFPILLYNGDKPWTAPLNLSELIEERELLGKYALNFEYFKIAEHEYTRDELLKIHNIVSTLFLTETYYDLELVKEKFIELFENKEDREAFSLFLNWFGQLYRYGTVSQADYDALKQHLYCSSEEVKTMLETLIAEEKEQFHKQWKEEAIQEGKQEAKIEDAKRMLAKDLPLDFIAEITGLSEETIIQLKIELEGSSQTA